MITLYSKPNCPYCDQAKHYLTTNSIPYEVINIAEDAVAKEFVLEQGHKTVPQIYYKDKLLVEGGFSGLSKLLPEEVNRRIEQHANSIKESSQ